MELKNSKLHVEDHGGKGRPVILIHGWPLSGKSWKKQIDEFKDVGYRVITYDRRGFGQSYKPSSGYDYDTFAEDLSELIEALDLQNITLVGFSMGGGEVARYIAKYGEDLLHSVIFASSITPMMMKSSDNPDGPLSEEKAAEMSDNLKKDPNTFYEQFVTQFFSANADGNLLVSDEEKQSAITLCLKADKDAALQTMQAFGTTDFREDVQKITLPTLIIHGDADSIVPFKGSADRTHEAISHSELNIIKGGPHGINVSHAREFNTKIVEFLQK